MIFRFPLFTTPFLFPRGQVSGIKVSKMPIFIMSIDIFKDSAVPMISNTWYRYLPALIWGKGTGNGCGYQPIASSIKAPPTMQATCAIYPLDLRVIFMQFKDFIKLSG